MRKELMHMKLLINEAPQNAKASKQSFENVIEQIEELKRQVALLQNYLDKGLHNLDIVENVIVGNNEIERSDNVILTTYTQTLNNLKQCEKDIKLNKTYEALRNFYYTTTDMVDMVDYDVKPHS